MHCPRCQGIGAEKRPSSPKPHPTTIPPELDAKMTPAVRDFIAALLARIVQLEAELEQVRQGKGKTPQNSSLPHCANKSTSMPNSMVLGPAENSSGVCLRSTQGRTTAENTASAAFTPRSYPRQDGPGGANRQTPQGSVSQRANSMVVERNRRQTDPAGFLDGPKATCTD